MDPLTITALSIGGAALGAATSAAGAVAQNRAVRRSMEANRTAVETQQQQVADQAALEKQKRLNQAQQVSGRLRVVQADTGLSMGQTFDLLDQQVAYDAALDTEIIRRNAANQIMGVRSGGAATAERLRSQSANPLAQLFGGALSGYSTGLSIGSSLAQSPGTTTTSRFNWGIDETAPNLHPEDRPLL